MGKYLSGGKRIDCDENEMHSETMCTNLAWSFRFPLYVFILEGGEGSLSFGVLAVLDLPTKPIMPTPVSTG